MSSKTKVRIQRGVSLQRKEISLPVKKKRNHVQNRQGTSPCIRMEGSYMAECSVVLPFFVGFMLVLLFFFQMLIVQQEVGNALLVAGRTLSVLSVTEEADTTEKHLAANVLVKKQLSKNSFAKQFVAGGKQGILVGCTDVSNSYLLLQADYKITIPIGLFGKRGIHFTQKLKCRKWTGNSFSRNEEEEIVYITPNGSVYHTKRDCTYLAPSIQKVRETRIFYMRNENGAKYYACEKCTKNKKTENGNVYITDYGNRYHSSKSCSKISRTVLSVRLSEVKDKRICSKCKKE